MFGFHKSKEFLDSRYRRRSDIKTLVKLHNNNAGRLVSTHCIHSGEINSLNSLFFFIEREKRKGVFISLSLRS